MYSHEQTSLTAGTITDNNELASNLSHRDLVKSKLLENMKVIDENVLNRLTIVVQED